MRKLIQLAFNKLGYQISRIRKAKSYYNLANQSPIDNNTACVNNQFYSDLIALEEYYRGDRVAFYKKVIQSISKDLLSLNPSSIIDVGCGIGYLASELSRILPQAKVSGCDFSEAAIAESKKRFPKLNFFVHDVTECLDDKYDAVLCTEVIEHLIDPKVAVSRLLDATKPNGILVFTVPNGRLDDSMEHINFWSPESWKMFIQECVPSSNKINCFQLGLHNNIAIVQLHS